MRFRSKTTEGYTVYAVSGVNSISFAIDASKANARGLLGFAVERHDFKNNERYFIKGFKVFKEFLQTPNENTVVSTFENPVQSFVWDDFTGMPDHTYQYLFYPIKGQPRNLDRTGQPIEVLVQTEPLYSSQDEHDVFFNRGVASSQAYARQFSNETPDKIEDAGKRKAVLNWLARDLKRAFIAFIEQAQKGDTLLGCFYEFRYEEIAVEFKKAIDHGVKVQIIIDAKTNAMDFPRAENLALIKKVSIPKKHVIYRTANPNNIQHNKFMVLLKGKDKTPAAVWTGSTNVSQGGLFGQTNVGHWVRNKKTASRFRDYWTLLSKDPGGKTTDNRTEKIAKNKTFKQAVVALQKDIAPGDPGSIPTGVTPIFSPRTTNTMLTTYAQLLDSATSLAGITLAFGVNDVFKQLLLDNTAKDQLTFMLLEKRDQPAPGSTKKFTSLTAGQNTYQAFGSYIKDPLYQWTKEVNTKLLQLNQHVLYIHSKFMLIDPLGDEPIVVTGSANFSTASTTANDENMLIIKGNKRVADIYFTEFNRLFNHYYFRSVYEDQGRKNKAPAASVSNPSQNSLFLLPNDGWLAKYKKGTLRHKRVEVFRNIKV
ncbi:MAG TPA: phospholipase D-like domain-containing protein [Candidatus Limnocylindria bacterium]|nr:phospholipase D-like domain-containing protein [Candidatus Limnocylindria bacterium]